MRKQASMLEIVAARCWNLLNEGQPFTPIFFTAMTMFVYVWQLNSTMEWQAFGWASLICLPFLVWAWQFSFPLYLRNYIWPITIAAMMVFQMWDFWWIGTMLFFYFFFTVIMWGSIYYHWRIRIPLNNWKTFWKQVLQNSDSTSGNAQEQLPKLMMLHVMWLGAFRFFEVAPSREEVFGFVMQVSLFLLAAVVYSLVLHRALLDWKPRLPEREADGTGSEVGEAKCDRVLVIVIDGMRKSRWLDADTPFLDRLCAEGAVFERMETIYPARTVVCFSSMFTGASPEEHGIRSNMVWHHGGVQVKSIFERLREVGKRGVMVAVAHLVEAFGADVRPYTVVVPNDQVDDHTIAFTRDVIEKEDPHLCIMQLIGVDQTGHSLGVFNPEYVRKMEQADRKLASFVDWYLENYHGERVHVIVCADHGQAIGIGGHGHIDEGEREVPFIMWGEGISSHVRVRERQSIVQMAATIGDALGLDRQEELRGRSLYKVLGAEGSGKP